jgi:flagellar motor switch protein FliN/FliY
MPEETPDETPDEADVEAEMLRMMQEEAEGGTEATEAEAPADAEAGEEGSVDDMLEQEMLRAMQEGGDDEAGLVASDAGGGGMAPFLSQMSGVSEAADGVERLAEVDVTVTIELGGNNIPIKDILAWSSDSVVELEPEEHEPLQVMVNGKLFARGEMVVVGDTFGVRIIELVDLPEEPHF